jgi:hypothetical protein
MATSRIVPVDRPGISLSLLLLLLDIQETHKNVNARTYPAMVENQSRA